MKLSCKYFLIDMKVDPRGKWALIFLGISVLFMILDSVLPPLFSGNHALSFMDLSWIFLGATGVKAFEYVKLRENEIKRDKELKLRHEENKCPHCGESFTFTQDWNIHILECEFNPKRQKNGSDSQ